MKPSEMKEMVEEMIAKGEMPSLDDVPDAVQDVREKYGKRIREAREKKS